MKKCAINDETNRVMDYIDKILALVPQTADDGENHSYIYEVLHKPKRAISCVKKAIELKPEDPSFYEKTGNLFADIDEYSNALRYYQKTVEIAPSCD
ncbi:MAG: tetratricopeptide repeat protein [Candidatus Thorarchaeota archaeon]